MEGRWVVVGSMRRSWDSTAGSVASAQVAAGNGSAGLGKARRGFYSGLAGLGGVGSGLARLGWARHSSLWHGFDHGTAWRSAAWHGLEGQGLARHGFYRVVAGHGLARLVHAGLGYSPGWSRLGLAAHGMKGRGFDRGLPWCVWAWLGTAGSCSAWLLSCPVRARHGAAQLVLAWHGFY